MPFFQPLWQSTNQSFPNHPCILAAYKYCLQYSTSYWSIANSTAIDQPPEYEYSPHFSFQLYTILMKYQCSLLYQMYPAFKRQNSMPPNSQFSIHSSSQFTPNTDHNTCQSQLAHTEPNINLSQTSDIPFKPLLPSLQVSLCYSLKLYSQSSFCRLGQTT